MAPIALDGELQFLLATDTVYDEDGTALSGARINRLMARLDHARLETLWRELHQLIPLGSWALSPTGAFPGRARIVGFARGNPGEPGHYVLLSTPHAQTFSVPAEHIAPTHPPWGGRVSSDDTVIRRGSPVPWPTTDVDLAHGYTLTHINALALAAARTNRWAQAMAPAERCEHAWSAIAEHLYASTEPPTRLELMRSAGAAINSHYGAHLSTHGRDSNNRSRAGGRFVAYWCPANPFDHAETLIEKMAFHQIWTELTPGQREAVTALAQHPTRARAAEALGLSRPSFNSRLASARTRFLALWHEGEKPSRVWVTDRDSGERRSIGDFMADRRRRSRIRQGKHTPRPLTPETRPGRDIGATNEELAAMNAEGIDANELSRRYGMDVKSIRRRISHAQRTTVQDGVPTM